MSLAKIIWSVSALAAVVLSFVGAGFAQSALVLALLGLLSGWFLDHDHRRGVIIAAIFLSGAVGGAAALNSIPAIGGHLTGILSALGSVFAAASVTAIVRTLVERLVKTA